MEACRAAVLHPVHEHGAQPRMTIISDHILIRPATPHDGPAIAALLVEGFGHQYGRVLNCPAGQRMYEQIYTELPERLQGVIVAVDAQDMPVAMAKLNTDAMQSSGGHRTVQIMLHELGIARMIQYQLWVRLTAPPPYHVQRHEAFVHSLTVTARWRGRGIAAALLNHLHGLAAGIGKTRVVVEVMECNVAARDLYARFGYTVRERRRGLLARLPGGPYARLLLEKQLGAPMHELRDCQKRFRSAEDIRPAC